MLPKLFESHHNNNQSTNSRYIRMNLECNFLMKPPEMILHISPFWWIFFLCRKWWQFHQNYNISISEYMRLKKQYRKLTSSSCFPTIVSNSMAYQTHSSPLQDTTCMWALSWYDLLTWPGYQYLLCTYIWLFKFLHPAHCKLHSE